MKVKLLRLIKRIACFFTGHPCTPTGRHGILLREWCCDRCGGLYVSHSDYGSMLLPADATSDLIFRQESEMMDRFSPPDAPDAPSLPNP